MDETQRANQDGYNSLQKEEVIRLSFPYYPGRPPRLKLRFSVTPDESLIQHKISFLTSAHEKLGKLGLTGFVIGMSGGIDSSVCAMLAVKALGPRSVHAVVVDYSISTEKLDALAPARRLIKEIGVSSTDVRIPVGRATTEGETYRPNSFYDLNLQARSIQSSVFEIADDLSYAVISTIDRSERILARYMEYFYGHVEPISDLFKSEVRDLGRALGASDYVLNAVPGCENWMWDQELFGVDYAFLDAVLNLMVDRKMSPDEISQKYCIDREWVIALESRIKTQRIRVEPQVCTCADSLRQADLE